MAEPVAPAQPIEHRSAPSGASEAPCVSRPPGLAARQVVVTRPQEQAQALSELILAQGGTPVWFPTIAIAPAPDTRELDDCLARLVQFDWVVFVSANAVTHAFARGFAWPADLPAGATGPGTAAQLRQCGVARVVVPKRQFDSEGLLAELDCQGLLPQRVLIIRGDGGREWLADALRARGVVVTSVASYQRARATPDPAALHQLLGAARIDAVTVTSTEGGEHLVSLLGKDALAWLNRAPMFVPHERIGRCMRQRGVQNVVVTAGGDEGLVAGLVHYFGGGT